MHSVSKASSSVVLISRRRLLGTAIGAGAALAFGLQVGNKPAAAAEAMIVYRDPGCGCCHSWTQIMQRHGFSARLADVDNLVEMKTDLDVPEALWGCHTALVAGYIIEGHVPVSAVTRVLADRPDILGLSVPGMPAGSPGMGGRRTEPLKVIAFKRDGSSYIFMQDA